MKRPPLQVQVTSSPVPMPLEQVDAWLDRYLEYILERRTHPSPQKPEVAA